MKRKFTKMMAALALLVGLMIPLGMWGQTTASITFSEQGYTNQQEISTVTFNGVTAVFDKGTNSNAPKYFTSGTAIRVYGGNTVTITANNETITAITITFGSSDGSNAITSNVGTYANGLWTGSATSVTFTVGGTSGNRRFAGLSVTYGSGGTPVETVATPTFSPAAGAVASGTEVSISCSTSGATIYYTTDGNTPTTSSSVYSAAITVDAAMTIKAIGVKSGYNNSEVAEAAYTIIVPITGYSIDFESDLSTYVDWEMNNMGNSNTDITAHGGSKYGANINDNGNAVATASITTKATIANPGTLTCYVSKTTKNTTTSTWYIEVSSDGTTWTEVANRDATNMEKGTWVEFSANLSSYHNVYVRVRYQGSNAIRTIDDLTLTTVEPSTDPSITVDDASVAYNDEQCTMAITYQNLTISGTTDFTIQFCDAEGNNATQPSWITEALVAEENGDYMVSCTFDANTGDERTAYLKVSVGQVTSNIATLTQAAYEAPFVPATYTLATSIVSGKTYIITSQLFSTGNIYAMGGQGGNNRAAISDNVSISENIVTVGYADVREFVITNEGTINNATVYSFYDATEEGYLYAASSSSNWLRTESTLDDNGKWTIVIDNEGEATITAQGTYTHNVMRYNNGNSLFSCYTSGNQLPVYLYEKNETTPTGIQLEIEPGQWYLIASPVGTVDPTEVDNMTTGEFALYNFNQNAAADQQGLTYEWENWKKEGDHYHFFLELGHGYLYAHSGDNTVALTFTGTPNQYDINNNVLPLIYNPDANLPGYNLLGNPFNETVYISGWPHYIMQNGSIIESQGGIAPMQGFFVIAENDDQSVNLSNEPTEKGASVALNVSRNRGNVIDRARVCFDESRQLPKLQLFENSTKVYIPQNGKDYAVVRSEGQGELPVNFRAAENGTYTLSIDAENMDMNYLHLIDNMTGMDIDLLQTPSYTFEANENDYESRFRLVFAGASTGSATDDSFAFYSNGSLIINNEGNATLQVVDLTGRILSSESVNGSVSTTLNAPTGVYMLRLINGDNVKVQKIVVR